MIMQDKNLLVNIYKNHLKHKEDTAVGPLHSWFLTHISQRSY